MSLFHRDNKKEEAKRSISEMPKFPELPKLPELPPFDEDSDTEETLHQLPSFPLNSLGEKFSQNTIKKAVAGKKEEEEVLDADESSDEEESEMMQRPLSKLRRGDFENYEEGFPIRPKSKEVSRSFIERNYPTRKAEPIFIRIDKFEESMHLFENIRRQISEIEHLIKNTKDIKTREEEELNSWENQLQEIKKQVEKVDQDIFSKIE